MFVTTSAAGLVVLLAAGAGFAVLLALVAARWGPLQAADVTIVDTMNAALGTQGAIVTAAGVITDVGAPPAVAVVLSVTVLWLLIRGLPRLATHVAVTGLGAAVLGPGVKELVNRTRPLVEVPLASAAWPGRDAQAEAAGRARRSAPAHDRPLPRGHETATKPVIGAVLLAGAVIAAGALITRELALIQRLDAAVVGWLADIGTPALTDIAVAAGWLGGVAGTITAPVIARTRLGRRQLRRRLLGWTPPPDRAIATMQHMSADTSRSMPPTPPSRAATASASRGRSAPPPDSSRFPKPGTWPTSRTPEAVNAALAGLLTRAGAAGERRHATAA